MTKDTKKELVLQALNIASNLLVQVGQYTEGFTNREELIARGRLRKAIQEIAEAQTAFRDIQT